MLKVKNSAELDKLAGRAPAKPAPAAQPAAPAPAPVKPAPPAPAAPIVDHEARALLRANADITRALSESVQQLTSALAQQARQPAPAAVPAAPPAPEPAPAAPAAPRAPFVPPSVMLGRTAPAQPEPEPEPTPPAPPARSEPIIATIARDKKDRLDGMSFSGGTTMRAQVRRDLQDRITEIVVVRDGVEQRAIIGRDSKKRIESITLQPAHPNMEGF